MKIFNGFQFDTPEDRNNRTKIIEKFDQYTIGELNETIERYNFNSRNQEENESIDAYVTALCTLAKTCNFCDCMCDSILRDQIVLGVRDKHTRKRLLQERKLDLKKCIDICRSTEARNSQLKTISVAQSKDAHGVKDKQQLPKRHFDRSKKNRTLEEKLGKTCKFCGQIHVFERGKCPAWGATCAKCKGRNHFASKCNSKVNSLREESDESEESDIEYITNITDRPEVVHAIKKEDYLKEIYTEMVVSKKPVKFQVDSGASVNVIPAELAPDEPLKRTTKTLQTRNDTTLQPLGSCHTILQNAKNGKKFSVEFLVAEKQLTPIIGVRAAQQMGLITVNEENFKIAQPPHRMSSAVKSINTTEEIVKHFPEVFQRELGTLPGTVHLEVDQNITPVVVPPRCVPASLKGQLKQELDCLQEIGVITPVDEPTQWVIGFSCGS